MAGNLQAIKAGQAYFQLFADNSELIAGLRRAENAVTRFMDNVQLIGTRLGNFGRSLTIPIADLISEYAKFDDQMRITAAVTNSTERVYRRLSQTALDATKKMTFKPVEAAGAMAQLGKAGFSSQEIEDSAESVMRLARATGVSLPEATRIASTVMRTFNMNSKQMGNVVDVMTASANTAMQSVTDLADALSYAGPIAAQVGMDIKETSKAVSVLANYGIRGSRAGTALRQMLSRMGNTRVQGLYKELGVEISDTSGKMRGLGEILIDVGKAMSNMPEATRLSYLTKLFGMYGMAGGAVLSAHGFDSVADAIENCDGVAQRTAERMDAGIGGFLRRLSTTLNRLGVTIGKVAAPAFMRWNAAVGLTGEILERIISRSGRLIRGILNFGMILTGMSAGFIGGAIALKGFAGILALVRTGITPVVRAVGLVGRSFAGLVGFAGKGIGAIKSVYASLRAFSLSKFSLKHLTFGKVGAGMLGFGAALHVLNSNAKEIKSSLEKLGETYPVLSKLTQVLSSLMDKFGIGSESVKKFTKLIAGLGVGFLAVQALSRVGETVAKLARGLNGLMGLSQRNFAGSLSRIGTASLAAGFGLRFLDKNLDSTRSTLEQFGKDVPALSSICEKLVKVLDSLSRSTSSLGKRADILTKIGGATLAIRAFPALMKNVKSFASAFKSNVASIWRIGTGAFNGIVWCVDNLARSLGRLYGNLSHLRFWVQIVAGFTAISTAWVLASRNADKLTASIRQLGAVFPEIARPLDYIASTFQKLLKTVGYLPDKIRNLTGAVVGSVAGFATAGVMAREWHRRTSVGFALLENIAGPATGAALRALAAVASWFVTEITGAGVAIQSFGDMLGRLGVQVARFATTAGVGVSTFQGISRVVRSLVSGDMLGNLFDKVIKGGLSVLSRIGNLFGEIASVFQTSIGSLGKGLFSEIIRQTDQLLESFNNLVRAFFGISKTGQGMFADLAGWLKNLVPIAQSVVHGIVDSVSSGVSQVTEIVKLAFAGFKAGQIEKTIAYLFAELQYRGTQAFVYLSEAFSRFLEIVSSGLSALVSNMPNIVPAFTSLQRSLLQMMETIRYKGMLIFNDLKYVVTNFILVMTHQLKIAMEDVLSYVYRDVADMLYSLVKAMGILGRPLGPVRAAGNVAMDKAIEHRNRSTELLGQNPLANRVGTYQQDRNDIEQTHANNVLQIDSLQFSGVEEVGSKITDTLQQVISKLDKQIEILKDSNDARKDELLAQKAQLRSDAQEELRARVENHDNNQDYKNALKDRREAAERKLSDSTQKYNQATIRQAKAQQQLQRDKDRVKTAKQNISALEENRDILRDTLTKEYGDNPLDWKEDFQASKVPFSEIESPTPNKQYHDGKYHHYTGPDTFLPQDDIRRGRDSYADRRRAGMRQTAANNDPYYATRVRGIMPHQEQLIQNAYDEQSAAISAVQEDRQQLSGLQDERSVQNARRKSAKAELKQIAKEERIMDKVYRDNPAIQESQKNISDLDQQLEDYIEGGGSSRSAYANKLRGRRRREQRRLNKMEKRRSRLEDKYGLSQDQQAQADFAAQAQMQMASNPIVNVQTQASSVGTFDPNALGGFDNAYWYREQTQKQTDVLTEIRDYAQSIDTALNEEASVAWL